MSHTPGPWKVGVEGSHVLTDDDYQWIIADCSYTNRERAEEHANARLIALAPLMLDALIVQEKLEQYGREHIVTAEWSSEYLVLKMDAHEKREKVLRMLNEDL